MPRHAGNVALKALWQAGFKERGQFVERDQIGAVVGNDMACARHDIKLRGSPSLSPQKERSMRVTKPCSASFCAERVKLCSFTVPIG